MTVETAPKSYCGVPVRSAEECAKLVESGDRLWIPPIQSTPIALTNAIAARADELRDVEIWAAMLMTEYPFMRPGLEKSFRYHSYFLSGIERKLRPLGAVDAASIAYTYLQEAYDTVIRANVVVTEVSEPEPDGTVCFGPTGGATNPCAMGTATKFLLQVNPNVPFIYGEGNSMNIKDATAICYDDHPLLTMPDVKPTEVEKAIADLVAEQVPDGATIQLGIGGLSGAIGYDLRKRKGLSVHSEMFTQSMMSLAKEGALTNDRKNHNPGVAVFGFAAGEKDLYEFLDHNPAVSQRPLSVINQPTEIAANDNLFSINSCISVDLTGQVASEAIGGKQISGIGGGLDFVRGARKSKGGRSFVCVASARRNKEGRLISNIVPTLPAGTVVSIPQSDVDAVVTEYGIADLANRSLADKARALIAIAHPELRRDLTQAAVSGGILPPSTPIEG